MMWMVVMMIGVDGSDRDGSESGRDGEDISFTYSPSFFLLSLSIFLFNFTWNKDVEEFLFLKRVCNNFKV